MLAIGRALMGKPSFQKTVEINKSLGITILLVEQNANLALEVSNYGYVLETGRVILHESAVFGKTSPSMTMVVRLLAVGADGVERLLGEYTFQHTRTIPGPPGWEW